MDETSELHLNWVERWRPISFSSRSTGEAASDDLRRAALAAPVTLAWLLGLLHATQYLREVSTVATLLVVATFVYSARDLRRL